MIFIPEPYFNEPGHELRGSKGSSHRYNRSTQVHTVQVAMLPWLADRLATPPDLRGAVASSSSPSASSGRVRGQPSFATIASLNPASSTQPSGGAFASSSVVGAVGGMATMPYPGSTSSFPSPPQPAVLAQPNQQSLGPQHHATMVNNPWSMQPQSPLVPTPTGPPQSQPGRAPPGLESPTKDDPIWGDVIRMHFRHKGQKVLAKIHEWEGQAIGLPNEDSLLRAAAKVEGMLKAHGFYD